MGYLKQLKGLQCSQLGGEGPGGGGWGPFLESPSNFSGPKSNIQIEI